MCRVEDRVGAVVVIYLSSQADTPDELNIQYVDSAIHDVEEMRIGRFSLLLFAWEMKRS